VAARPSVVSRLKWIWTPLPMDTGSMIGEKQARPPNWRATSRVDLAQNDGPVGRHETARRAHGQFELLRSVFPQDCLRLDPGPGQSLGESTEKALDANGSRPA